jgi:DNA-binding transcriptional LysR family regulator
MVPAMIDLNDYAYFAEVVRYGGFAPAGRALRLPKSKLSRRVAGLEARLGARLIERSSRRFRVTEVGEAFYARCRAMLDELEQAETLVAEAQSEPRGRVRFSCPTGLIDVLSPRLPDFLLRYPKIQLQMIALDRAVDLIAERIDVALRVRTELTTDASLTMRTLGRSRRILVAAPAFATAMDSTDIADLHRLPTLGSTDDAGEIEWHLVGPDEARLIVRHEPRMTCADFGALCDAAAGGLGIALLPDHVCGDDLRSGRLVRVFPGWGGQMGIVHLVFTTRRGLPQAVRAFIDHLARTFAAITLEP